MTDDSTTKDTLAHAQALLKSRFLARAAKPGAQAEVNASLDGKMSGLKGDSEIITRLKGVSGQAAQLWKNRSQLSRKHALYLTAGLLYFISPVDAVTDLIPILGYVDDVAVLGWILSQIVPAVGKLKEQVVEVRDATINQATDQLVDKGRDALNTLVDERTEELLERLDVAADEVLQKYVSAVVIGLWGTTTAAALSLALSVLAGGYTPEWMAYVGTTTLLVLAWNISVALVFWRRYHALDARWQEKLPRIIGAKLVRARHLVAVGLPLLAFAGLAIAHITLN